MLNSGETMSARSTEKVAAVFRRWFRHQDERDAEGGHGGADGGGAGPSGSPRRRGGLLRVNRHRDGVRPTESAPTVPGSPAEAFAKLSAGGAGAASAGSGRSAAPNVPRDRAIRARRLMKEYKEIQRVQRPDPLFTVGLVNDNLFEWHVRLHKVDPESELAADMREFCVSDVLLHISFPENFPFAPPFMRVIEPRIEKGFVMEGGAICMELLTPRGWASAYTVEAVLMQFAASLVKGRARIARKNKAGKDFSKRSAEESFRTLVKTHDKYGWVTPDLSDG